MQSVLCVDLSQEQGEITLTTVSGNLIEVRAKKTLPFGKAALLNAVSVPAIDDENSEEEDPLSTKLMKELSEFSEGWSNSVLVVPEKDFLGLTLDLPFNDSKSVERVLDLEVQDVLPFEIDDFLIQHHILGAAPQKQGMFDVFVGLLPREIVKRGLEILRGAGVEPVVVTTPGSAASSAFYLASQYFNPNSLIITIKENEFTVLASFNGKVIAERSLILDTYSEKEKSLRDLFLDIKLTASSLERRYNKRFEIAYVLGTLPNTSELQQILGRPVEEFALKDVMKTQAGLESTASLAAFFAQDDAPSRALCNFRIREFSYSQRFQEFLRGLASLKKHALAALFSVVFLISLIYYAREYYINSQNSALAAEVNRIVPNFVSSSGNILSDLREQETKLADELGTLGSPARVTPLDVLAGITKDLPDIQGLTISTVKITGIKATVEGVAPDLSAVDKIEKALKTNKKLYAKVSAQTGASAATKGYRFTLDIGLQ